MKAWVLHDIGDIRFEEVAAPKPAAGEVLIRVGAVGICGSDIPRVYDTGAHKMPLIPGHEFAGEVVGTGEGVDEEWINKRVGVFPLIPCGACSQCKANRYELCRNYDYIGSRRDGAFAEYVTVPAANLIELPEGVLYDVAAMSEPMAVAVHAIRRVLDIGSPLGNRECVSLETCGKPLGENENKDISIAVYGLGTIGMFVTMFLKAAGYNNLILIGNKESQKRKIISMGISEEHYFDNSGNSDTVQLQNKDTSAQKKSTMNVIEQIRNLGGADVVFECVGRSQTYADAIDIAAPMGRVMLVGNPYSNMTLPRNIYWKILRNQLTVMGTWNSSFSIGNMISAKPTEDHPHTDAPDDDWHYVYKLLSEGAIHPDCFITHRYSLKDLETGLKIMRDKSEEYVKIIVKAN